MNNVKKTIEAIETVRLLCENLTPEEKTIIERTSPEYRQLVRACRDKYFNWIYCDDELPNDGEYVLVRLSNSSNFDHQKWCKALYFTSSGWLLNGVKINNVYKWVRVEK